MMNAVIKNELEKGALFVVSHSAGKDSQAMLIRLRQMDVPDSQMIIVHADLGDVEWKGNPDHTLSMSQKTLEEITGVKA